MEHKIAVLGAGSWGTALAVSLAGKGYSVRIWDVDQAHVDALRSDRENRKYLPGVKFFESMNLTDTAEEAITGSDVVLFAAPAQHFRSALLNAMPFLTEDMVLVNVAKGIEQRSLKRMSEIASEILPGAKYVALSGPSHAEEVGRGLPNSGITSEDIKLAEFVQDIL